MGARQAWRAIRKRWLLLVSVVLLCLAVGGLVTARTQRTYSATAVAFVSVVLPNDPAALAATNTFVTARVQSYVSLVTTPSVTDAVASELQPLTSRQVAAKLTATAPLNKVLINIQADDTSAARAAAIANAAANRFVAVVADLEKSATTTASPVRVTVIQPATEPSAPVRPRTTLNLALALLAGLLLGFAAVRLREALDDPVRRPAELEAASGRPLLGVLPGGLRGLARRRSPSDRTLSAQAGGLLAANVESLAPPGALGVVAVTSLREGEGKTLVTIALGQRLGEDGIRVCLIDAHLRAPALAARLGLRSNPGLTSARHGVDAPEQHLQQVSQEVFALAAGPRAPNPAEVLARNATGEVVDAVARLFQCTVVDTGPLQPHSDGLRASRLADGVLLVVSARARNRTQQVAGAVAALEAEGVPVLGTVLNHASNAEAQRFLALYPAEEAAPRTVYAQPGRHSRRSTDPKITTDPQVTTDPVPDSDPDPDPPRSSR